MRLLLTFTIVFFFSGIFAQQSIDFSLIKDINPDTNSDPFNENPNDADNAQFAVLNNTAYFRATDGINGYELWKSNGTSSGTSLVKDIAPGIESSYPSMIVATDSKIFFATNIKPQLWVSDGTEAGTNVLTFFGDSMNIRITNVYAGSVVCYFLVSSNSIRQLWKSDGTISGTTMVYDFTSMTYPYSYISNLIEVNDILFFRVETTTIGAQVWRSDRTISGTYFLQSIYNGNFANDYAEKFTKYNNRLYFTADNGTGRKIWVTDSLGTTAAIAPKMGTIVLARENKYPYINNYPFVISNNVLYFIGNTPETGSELYRYDVKKGAKLVADIKPGAASSTFVGSGGLKDVNGTLYFLTIDSSKYSLRQTKGTANNTKLVKTFGIGEAVQNLFNGNGTLFFSHSDATYGNELWKSNGTDATTVMVSDIYTGVNSSNPGLFTYANGRILFRSYIPKKGNELWITDGTTARTSQVKEINPSTTSSSLIPVNYFNHDYYGELPGNAIVFPAYVRDAGYELFYSDGTKAGTRMVADLNKGVESSFPNTFISKNNLVYFEVFSGPSGIYRSDGTESGTVLMVSLPLGATVYTVADDGSVYYTQPNSSTLTKELWRIDSTYSVSVKIAESFEYIGPLVAVGNDVYYVAGAYNTGYNLWVTNGTANGTRMLTNNTPYSFDAMPINLFGYEGELYFGLGNALWKSNGSVTGTFKLSDVTLGFSYDNLNNGFCISNNILYFSGYTATNGFELWKTNGSANGTKMVKDVNIGTNSSSIGLLTDANGILFFMAKDSSGKYGLYNTNGTSSQTRLIKYFDTYPYNMKSVDSSVYFNFDDLWTSDGTSNGTKLVKTPGMSDIIDIINLKASGGNLFFSGYTNMYGWELYGDNALTPKLPSSFSNNIITSNNKIEITAFPNPAQEFTKLKVQHSDNASLAMLKDITGKTVWTNKLTGNGELMIQLQGFTPGVYFLSVYSGLEVKTIKLIKQ